MFQDFLVEKTYLVQRQRMIAIVEKPEFIQTRKDSKFLPKLVKLFLLIFFSRKNSSLIITLPYIF